MAEYLPPTETLPKFNEFVFDDAYSIEGIDRRAVHKAGVETITGVKTITGDFYINNLITNIISATSFTISSAINFLNGTQNRIASNLGLTSTSIGNKIDCQGGYNLMTSATTAPSGVANWIEATNGGYNTITTNGAGGTTIRIATGMNLIENTAGSNVLEALTTGTNTIRSASGTNTLSAVGVGGVNIIDGTTNRLRVGGTDKEVITSTTTDITNTTITNVASTAFKVQQTAGTDKINVSNVETKLTNQYLTVTSSGTNTLTAQVASTTSANLIDATGTGSGNLIRVGTGQNKLENTAGSNLLEALTTGTNTIRSATGNNVITTSAGENFMNITAGIGSNVLQVTSTSAGAGNKLFANNSANGFNQIIGYNNYYDVNSSGAQYIRVNGGDKIVVNSTDTTITNANVGIVGKCNASSYNLGTNASNTPLLTYSILAQRPINNQGISAGTVYDMYFGGNNTSTAISAPTINIVSQKVVIFYDSGTFVGGGVCSGVINLISTSTGGTLSTSASFFINSGSLAGGVVAIPLIVAPTLATALRVQITISNTVAITGSFKNIYAQLWFSQNP